MEVRSGGPGVLCLLQHGQDEGGIDWMRREDRYTDALVQAGIDRVPRRRPVWIRRVERAYREDAAGGGAGDGWEELSSDHCGVQRRLTLPGPLVEGC